MSKPCVVIEHLAVEHVGTIGPVLKAHGFEVVVVPAANIHRCRDIAEQAALLIVMGGPIGVYDAPDYPFLTDEIDIIRGRLGRRRPVLGICLGSQLMAAALDAHVYPGTAGVELGWAPVQLTEHGERHAISHIATGNAPVLHWHGDTFELPAGATLLASTERYSHQAFAVENFGLALQFHVETDQAELEQWFVAFAGDIRSMGPDKLSSLRSDTAIFAEDLARRNAAFISDWISQL